MLPGLMPVPAIVGIGGPVVGAGNGTPIGLLLALTWVPPLPVTGGTTGTPIGLLLSLTKEIPAVVTGTPIGLLLSLTVGSGGGGGFVPGEFTDDGGETSFIDDDGATDFIDDG
jgi:hypothetical protein